MVTMAIPRVMTVPLEAFEPKADETLEAYQARRAMIAERRRIFDVLTADINRVGADPPDDGIGEWWRFDWGDRR